MLQLTVRIALTAIHHFILCTVILRWHPELLGISQRNKSQSLHLSQSCPATPWSRDFRIWGRSVVASTSSLSSPSAIWWSWVRVLGLPESIILLVTYRAPSSAQGIKSQALGTYWSPPQPSSVLASVFRFSSCSQGLMPEEWVHSELSCSRWGEHTDDPNASSHSAPVSCVRKLWNPGTSHTP